jgi:hypothetical protein
MHRHFVAVISWSVVIAAAAVLIREVHRDHQPQPAIAAAAAVTTPVVEEAEAPQPKINAYAGNTSSKKFHATSCRYYSCTNCTAYFATRDEASEAGYVPGGCCRP